MNIFLKVLKLETVRQKITGTICKEEIFLEAVSLVMTPVSAVSPSVHFGVHAGENSTGDIITFIDKLTAPGSGCSGIVDECAHCRNRKFSAIFHN
jgi:hypothetical protein